MPSSCPWESGLGRHARTASPEPRARWAPRRRFAPALWLLAVLATGALPVAGPTAAPSGAAARASVSRDDAHEPSPAGTRSAGPRRDVRGIPPELAAHPCGWWIPLVERRERAADLIQRVEMAAAKGNVEALASLAREADDQALDPWILVDDLCERGSEAAALALVPFVVRQTREVEAALLAQSVAPDRNTARAELWSALGELADGQPHSASRRLERVAHGDDPSILCVRVLAARAHVAEVLGEPERAAAHHQRAALAAEQLGWWGAAVLALEAGGRAASHAGKPARAAALFGGLRRVQSQHGALRDQALALLALGEAEHELGDGPSALQRALEAARLASAGSEHDVAGAAHSLALEVCVARGALAAAHDARRAADRELTLGLAEASMRHTHELRCAALDLALGRADAARPRLEGAATRFAQLGDARGAARAHGLLADLHASAGRRDAAGAAWLAARDALAGAHAWEGAARAQLEAGFARIERAGLPEGDAPLTSEATFDARAAARRADAARSELERVGMRAAALEARLAAAELEVRLGGDGAALSELEACRDEARVLGLLPLRVAAETAMVRLHVRAKRWGAATSQARSALEQVGELGKGLGEADRVALHAEHAALADLAVLAAAGAQGQRAGDAAGLWFEALEARVAATLLRALGARPLRGSDEPDRELARRAVERRRVHAQLMAARSATDASPALREALERDYVEAVNAEQAAQAAWERERDADARADHLRPIPASLGELRARLAPDEVYAAYALLAHQAWALVVERGGARAVLLADGEADVRALVAAVERVSRLEPATGQPDLAGEAGVAARERLERVLLRGLGLSPKVRRLVICPDAELAFVPWAWVRSEGLALDVSLAPSATTFLWQAGREAPAGRGVLALGDPAYAAAPARKRGWLQAERARTRPALLPDFRPLPYTALEVEGVAVSRADLILRREEATEDGLWEALASRGPQHRWRSVHLAAHGHLDPAHPAMAMLALAPSAREDGLLTVAEILRHVVETDLVVLSACQTGRGELRRGEGLIGLCRAFMVAGAPRVVASLWDVPDDATRLLMEDFYLRLDGGADAVVALREAQEAVRTTHPEPAAWAGWVLWGLPGGPGPLRTR
jgi:hypothetical protein